MPASSLTAERVVRYVFSAVAVVVAAWLLWYFSTLVLYLVAGMVLAYLMRPLVDRLQGLGLGRIGAILAAFVLVFGGLIVLLTYLTPFLAEQFGALASEVSAETITGFAASVEAWLGQFVPVRPGSLVLGVENTFQALFTGGFSSAMSSALGVFTNVFYAVLVIPFVTFFFLKDGFRIRHNLLQLVPNRYFEATLAIVEKVETTIGRYFRALLVQGLSVAAVATVLLTVVGVDYAVVIGLFTGLANTIPYFGPLMGFLAGTLAGIAQTGDFSLVPGILVAMALTQLADNVFFQPFIFSKAARAHPLIILFVVLIGAQVAGIVGMLIAIPVATTLRVIVREVRWSLQNYRILRPLR